MLNASTMRPLISAAAAVSPAGAVVMVQSRNMATLKEIQMRLRSVKNIEKITKSMKMIASTKMTRAQKIMDVARVYGKASNSVFTHAGTVPAASPTNALVVAVSSDRGLCGSIHSSISKAVKAYLGENESATAVILGMKAKAQIQREYRGNISIHFEQIAKNQPTWTEAALIADAVLANLAATGKEVDAATVFYNSFKSVIAFETTKLPVYTLKAIEASPKISAYEIDENTLKNFEEFSFANAVFWGIAEGNASEQAAKRTAMENATKNAGEVIQKLTMTYNRSRQAAITNDLIDIITGASAM